MDGKERSTRRSDIKSRNRKILYIAKEVAIKLGLTGLKFNLHQNGLMTSMFTNDSVHIHETKAFL